MDSRPGRTDVHRRGRPRGAGQRTEGLVRRSCVGRHFEVITSPAAINTRKWQVLVFLFCAGGLNYADRTAISSLFPLLRADLALTDVGMAAVGSLFLWSYAATSPIAGMVADRISRSHLIAFSLAAWSIVTALPGFAPNT